MLPLPCPDRLVGGFENNPAIRGPGVLDVEYEIKLIAGYPFGAKPIRILTITAVTTEENLLNRLGNWIGPEAGFNPTLDRERVGELEVGGIAQLDLRGHRVTCINPAWEHQRISAGRRLNQAGGRIGRIVNESAIIAANEVPGALIERIDIPRPPTYRSRSAQRVVDLIAMPW